MGALGVPGVLGHFLNKNRYQYHDVMLNQPIQNAFQALAIDEQRKPFLPDVWIRPNGWTGQLEQAWFAGVHSNVGGGYAPDGLANEARHWIVEKAEKLGLEFDSTYLAKFTPCFNSILDDSMAMTYKLMGLNVRKLGQNIADGETIHQSAIDRKNHAECNYAPKNLEAALVGSAALNATSTTRISRGVPCSPLPLP